MVTLTINAELNTPYQYKGSTTINEQVLTKTYDPNSEYNKSLFTYNNGAGIIKGVSNVYDSKHPQTLYFPNSCTSIKGPRNTGFGGTVVSKTLDFRFSKLRTITSFSTIRKIPGIVNITFKGNKYFTYSGGATNNFAENANLAFIDLSNSAITNIAEGMFKLNTKLSRILFSGCTSLSSIGNIAFQNCTSLTELDFSSCPLASVNTTAFQGCTGLTQIYVKDDASKQLILAALTAVNLQNQVTVTIKI